MIYNMKTNSNHRFHYTFIILINVMLIGLLSLTTPAHADVKTTAEKNTLSSTQTNTPTLQADKNAAHEQKIPDRKTTLINDSRGLSAFFVLGIAINIIMAITFAWWFSSEWRKTKK